MDGSALQQALTKFGKGVFNTGVGLTGAATNTGMDIANSVVHNLAQDFAPPQTRSLPPSVQSPIPVGQVTPHQVAPSWLQYGADALASHLMAHPAPQQPIAQLPQQPSVMDTIRQRFATPQPSVSMVLPGGQLPAGLTPGQVTTTPPVTPTPTTHWLTEEEALRRAPTPALDPLEQSTIQIFQQHGINPAVAYGIAQAEGGRIGSHNVWNINATDSNPTGATNYDSHQQAAEGAAQTMAALLKKAGYSGKDADGQIKAIESAGYAGDPRTWQQRSAATGGAGKNGIQYWSDFVRSTDAWKKWAHK